MAEHCRGLYEDRMEGTNVLCAPKSQERVPPLTCTQPALRALASFYYFSATSHQLWPQINAS